MQHQEKYNLTWHSYSDHLRGALRDMMASTDFADVTLVTDDKQQIRAHRNILSACSPVFKNILQLDSSHANPVIYLRGIQHTEMESIMQYIYLGKAVFHEERMMSEFLMVSKNLEIKELSDINIESYDNKTNSNYELEDNVEDVSKDTTAKILKVDLNAEHLQQQFIHQSNLTTHIQSKHEGLKYACNLCDKQYTQQVDLTRHIQCKHEGVKYSCNLCKKQFTQQGHLRRHFQSAHEGTKYACNQCDMQFARQDSLTIHIQSTHEGVKYICNQCGQEFRHQNSLTIHIQSVHEGVRYACNQCDYQATQQSGLTKHIKSVHEGVKYACNQCDKQYADHKTLRNHIQSKHASNVSNVSLKLQNSAT